MEDRFLLQVSAFSGLAGAVLTQALTGLFAFVSDRRKARNEVNVQLRAKRIEVAENFYFVTGETMAVLQKNIAFWKNRNDSRSEASLRFLSKEVKALDEYLGKVQTENWRYNLVSLYFDVTLSHNEIIAANTKSHLLYLKILDIAEKLTGTSVEDNEPLLGEYNLSIFDLCTQYDHIYALLEQVMQQIKSELLHTCQ